MRLAATAATVLVLAGAGGVLAGTGGDEGRQPAPPAGDSAQRPAATVALLSTNRGNISRLGYVRVRVRVRRASGLRLFAVARRAAGGKAYTVTKRRLVRMRGGGKRVLRLRLNAAGRRIFTGCRALAVRPSGRARTRATRASVTRRLRSGARRVQPDPRRCAANSGPGPGGSGPGSGSGAGGNPGTGGGGSEEPPEDISAPPGGPPLGELNTADADRCDFLDPSVCLYPFPNDHFTVADATKDTGRRLNLNLLSMPRNKEEKPIDPTDQNRADGFSPGNMIIARVPGLDSQEAFDQTGAVPITDMARSFNPAQPVVVINARTGERQLIWAEVDANPEDPADRTLIIRPGKNFEEGERYIVALRGLKDAEGNVLAPREEFRAYRDGIATENEDIEARRAHYEDLFKTLGRAGIARKDLYLAWDFTVASARSLAGRALKIRDDAFAKLDDTDLDDLQVLGEAPVFSQADLPPQATEFLDDYDTGPIPANLNTVDGRQDFEPCSAGSSPECEEGESNTTARVITGQLAVPCYLNAPGCPPGSGFAYGPDGEVSTLGATANTTNANVICTIPRQAVDGGADSPQTRPSLYGHGLLGGAGEVRGGNVQAMGQEHGFTFCATDWAGMSTFDVPNVLVLLQDLSTFSTLVDRIQQGYVNFMYLGRWMLHPQGASANEGFQVDDRSVVDTERLFYDGNSQGGILSGGLTAITPDFQRAVHGVPGMNYSTLLRRSVDFDMYAKGEVEGQQLPAGGLYQNYPNELERPLILSLIQLLWDRGEANGYAQHMTDDPYPNTPEHQVLLHPAFGDHQVANVSADVEARTIGASAYRPALFDGRSPDVFPLYGIPTAPLSGFTGSAIVYWDTGPLRIEDGKSKGTPPPPTENVPPREGNDPHGAPRADVKGRQQKSEFLKVGGTLFNPCGAGPCYADGFTGP